MCPPEAIISSATTPNLSPDSLVPPTETSKSAFELASSLLHPAILNHSIRTYLYALTLAKLQKSSYATDPNKQDLLFTACIFHDIGTTDTYNTGPSRFEVEGADAAVIHLTKFGVSEESQHEVWKAIGLHTCKGIVHRMGELPALVRLAIEIDFGRKDTVDGIDDLPMLKRGVEKRFERGEIEKTLGDRVALQAVGDPDKAPDNSWPGGLYRSHLANPGWTGVNKAF